MSDFASRARVAALEAFESVGSPTDSLGVSIVGRMEVFRDEHVFGYPGFTCSPL